jgi:hypothetical protein
MSEVESLEPASRVFDNRAFSAAWLIPFYFRNLCELADPVTSFSLPRARWKRCIFPPRQRVCYRANQFDFQTALSLPGSPTWSSGLEYSFVTCPD